MLETIGTLIKGIGLRLAGGKTADWCRARWNHLMYGPRVCLALDWQGPGIYFFDRPNQSWRCVQMTVVAGRNDEFVIASGSVEVRPIAVRGKWIEVVHLANLLRLPIAVAKHRPKELRLSGSSVAQAIAKALPGASQVEIRLRLRDYHRLQILSEPLEIDTAELLREKLR